MAARAESDDILDGVEEDEKESFEKSVEIAKTKLASIPGFRDMADAVDKALADGRLSEQELISILSGLAAAAVGTGEVMVDENANIFKKIAGVKGDVEAVDVKAEVGVEAAEALGELDDLLDKNAMTDQGSLGENFKRGAVYVNGKRFDSRTLLLGFAMMKALRMYRALPDGTSFTDSIWRKDEPEMIQEFIEGVSWDMNLGVILTVYDEAIHTHVKLWTLAAGIWTVAMTPIKTAFPTATSGQVFPIGAAGLEIYHLHEIAPSHDQNGLITIAALFGLSGVFDHALTEAAPLVSQGLEGLISKSVTGADFAAGA